MSPKCGASRLFNQEAYCSGTAGKFFIEGNFLIPVNCGSHSDYQTLLLKIFVNIILIRMSFPVIHGISLNASGTSIKVKQPKQKGSKAQPVEKVTYQSSMPEFRWHDQSEFREIILL